MNKKVSIILPVYNGARYVGRSIESVLNQTYKNLELIIVNDGSTDNTEEIIGIYATQDERIRIINNEANQRLPRSLNIGFAQATGDYYSWTSDDNSYKPEAIENMVNVLNNRPDIDLVYADYSMINMDGTLIRKVQNADPDEIKFRCVVGACFLYTKKIAKLVGEYNPDMYLAEDYEYWIRCYKYGKFIHINDNLYYYGVHDGNLTSTRQKEIRHQAYYAMNYHFDFLISQCKTQEEKNRYYWRTLELLEDSRENMSVRKKYYRYDKLFKQADIKRRIKNFIYNGIPSLISQNIR